METKQQLIKAIRETARKGGKRALTRREFLRATGGSTERIARHFEGWNKACAAAGLEVNRGNKPLSDDMLFGAMRDTFVKLGRIAPRAEFQRHFPYFMSVFVNRGWNWPEALVALRHWLTQNDPAFPFLDQLPTATEIPSGGIPNWRSLGGRVCGDPLNFRGFLHAPTNEIGTAMLFAIVAFDLGFVIESAQQAFPDCQAKRHVGNGRWEQLSVELEFQSRNFLHHKHDAKKCHVVVCWEDNWPRCPIEVIELKTEIEKLRKLGRG